MGLVLTNVLHLKFQERASNAEKEFQKGRTDLMFVISHFKFFFFFFLIRNFLLCLVFDCFMITAGWKVVLSKGNCVM